MAGSVGFASFGFENPVRLDWEGQRAVLRDASRLPRPSVGAGFLGHAVYACTCGLICPAEPVCARLITPRTLPKYLVLCA